MLKLESVQAKQPFGFFCSQLELILHPTPLPPLLNTCLFCLSVCRSVCLYVCLFCFCLSAFLCCILSALSSSTNRLFTAHLISCINMLVCPSVCLSVFVSVCLSDTDSGVLSVLSSSTNWLAAHCPRLEPPASIYKLPTAADRLHTLSLPPIPAPCPTHSL